MKRFLFLIIVIASAVFLASCYDDLVDSPAPNKAPKSFISLFPDSVISQQQSRLRVHWWGDDPDGLVIGFFISSDNTNWVFTSKNDSTISFPITGTDTTIIFKVAAVDNYGNYKYDAQTVRHGVNYGPEPFTDLDSNGVYTAGEPFTDIGEVDMNPASIKLPLKNSPPVLKFLTDKNGITISVPETTFTVASFGWTADDIDGIESIKSIYVSLNDSTTAIEIPSTTRFITIKAVPPFTSDVVNCDIYLGTSINTPYSVKLPNLKLNADNKIYISAKDIAGASSQFLKMPVTGGKWYVKKPKGEILIIDDYGTLDNAADFYNAVFDSLNLLNKVDVMDIKFGRTTTSYGTLLPKFISPMFTETLKLFKYVFWYSENDPTLEPAQICIPSYVQSGGKILFSMVFPQIFDARGLNDFLPVDSLSPAPISLLFPNTQVNPTAFAVSKNYPQLARDASATPVARIRTYYPNPLTADVLYTLGLTGNPVISFKSKDSRIIFMGLPLHRTNGSPFKVKDFFSKVFFDEFGVSK